MPTRNIPTLHMPTLRTTLLHPTPTPRKPPMPKHPTRTTTKKTRTNNTHSDAETTRIHDHLHRNRTQNKKNTLQQNRNQTPNRSHNTRHPRRTLTSTLPNHTRNPKPPHTRRIHHNPNHILPHPRNRPQNRRTKKRTLGRIQTKPNQHRTNTNINNLTTLQNNIPRRRHHLRIHRRKNPRKNLPHRTHNKHHTSNNLPNNRVSIPSVSWNTPFGRSIQRLDSTLQPHPPRHVRRVQSLPMEQNHLGTNIHSKHSPHGNLIQLPPKLSPVAKNTTSKSEKAYILKKNKSNWAHKWSTETDTKSSQTY